MAGWFSDNFPMFVLWKAVKGLHSVRSLFWKPAKARIVGALADRTDVGCNLAEIRYQYSVDGKTYRGKHREPFLGYSRCWHYARTHEVGVIIDIRMKRRKPWVSVALI